ncbi:MAG: hypothetical protein VW270_15555, partial [Candidatus Poseidoniales archaeon]
MALDSAISTKITDLDDIGGSLTNNDILPVVDVLAGETKSVRVDDLTSHVATAITTDDVAEANNLYYTDARVETVIDSAYIQSRQSFSSFDSDEVQAMIDSALSAQIDSGQVVKTVNGIHPSPSGDIGIHGGNTQTDAGSGITISAELDTKVERIRDTSTGTNYDPVNGRIDLDFSAMGGGGGTTLQSTDSLAEGSLNLYYTDTRVESHVDSA